MSPPPEVIRQGQVKHRQLMPQHEIFSEHLLPSFKGRKNRVSSPFQYCHHGWKECRYGEKYSSISTRMN